MELSKLIRCVRCQVNNNDHGGAYQTIAESPGEKELAGAFDSRDLAEPLGIPVED